MKFSIFAICCILGAYAQDNNEAPRVLLVKEDGQENLVEWLKNANQKGIEVQLDEIELGGDDDDNRKICAGISGVALILDVTWSGNGAAEKTALENDIPYLQIDASISPYLQILDSYLEYRNSTDVVLIFDNADRVDQALYYWIDSTLMRMAFSETLDDTVAKNLKNIKPIPNNYAIVGSTKNVTKFFSQALSYELVKLPQRWNLVFLDFDYSNFDHDLIQNRPVNLIKIDKEICCMLLEIDNDRTCPQNFNLQQQFVENVVEVLKKIFTALVGDDLELNQNVECGRNSYSNQIKSKFEELLEDQREANKWLFKDDHKIKVPVKGFVQIGMDEVAKYTFDNGIEVNDGKEIPSITPFYRIGITHALPWSFKETDQNGNEYWTGYCVDFAKNLSEYLKFDFEFVEPQTGTFGQKINGEWDGVIGDLARGETDLVITALIMTADREEVVDFVAPYFEQTGITIVMRKPIRKTSLFKFMTVLKLEVWISIVGALIVTGFMVWFLDKYSPYSARNNKKAHPYPCREFTLKESFWFALTSFTPQGGGEAPKSLSGRTLVAAYWLFVVLMLATFTANLAAFLTVERMQTPVQSLEQLAKQSRINYTVVKESDTHQYFINMKHAEDTLYRLWKELTLNASTDDTQYRVWDYPIKEQYGHILLAINDSNPVGSAAEGFQLVDQHTEADFAFIHDSSEIRYEISQNCNLTEVGELFAEKPFAVAVQQGSHLQDSISKAILILQKERFFEQLQAKYWNHSSKGDCPSTDDNEGITLDSLGGVFIATLFGLALAMLTLVGEVIYYRKKGKKNKNAGKDSTKIYPKTLSLGGNYGDKNTITIGTAFKPVNYGNKGLTEISHINLYPRARKGGLPQIDYLN